MPKSNNQIIPNGRLISPVAPHYSFERGRAPGGNPAAKPGPGIARHGP